MAAKRLQEQVGLGGAISVDRSSAAHGKGGHAWVRYTDTKGTIWILDLSKHFNDSLEHAYDLWAEDPTSVWPYWRAADRDYLSDYREGRRLRLYELRRNPFNPFQ